MSLAEIPCITRCKRRSRRIKNTERQAPKHDIRIQTIRCERRDLRFGGRERARNVGGFRTDECGGDDEDGVVVDCDVC